jgi:hypothetical protein
MSKKALFNESSLGVNPLSISLEIKVANVKTAENLLCEFSDGINLPVGTLEKKYPKQINVREVNSNSQL